MCSLFTVSYTGWFISDIERAKWLIDISNMFLGSIIATCLSFTALVCYEKDRKWPLNYILLIIFTWGTAHIFTYAACRKPVSDARATDIPDNG